MSSKDFRRLRLDGVSRDFGTLNALREVSLEVRRGEFIALLGPSGCGKSTALNCLAGLLPLTAGSIWLDDTRIDPLPPEERGFGMVFQNYALFPHMSARRNVGFGLAMQRRPKDEIERRAEQALALVHLEGQGHKLPGQLSGGQQQRVAIARAVVIEPPLVLMDEPLSNLDAKLRLEMRSEIRRIHDLVGSATIYVTHDQEEALSMADRIVVLRDGRVRQIGTPLELYGRPAHVDVAEFMGFRNLIPGRIEQRTGDAVRVVVGGAVGNAVLHGSAVDNGDGEVTLAIRPEDLTPRPNGPLEVTVAACEYRGRDSFGRATMADGSTLYFRCGQPVAAGQSLRLGADADCVLVYART